MDSIISLARILSPMEILMLMAVVDRQLMQILTDLLQPFPTATRYSKLCEPYPIPPNKNNPGVAKEQ